MSKPVLSPNKIISIFHESNQNGTVGSRSNIKVGDFVLVFLPVQTKTNVAYKNFYTEVLPERKNK